MYSKPNRFRLRPSHRLLSVTMMLCLTATANSLPSWASDQVPNLTPSEIATTIKLLQACDQAQTASRATIQVNAVVQAKQEELLKAQTTEMVQLKESANSPLRNPILWFAAGMLVTGLTVHWVR